MHKTAYGVSTIVNRAVFGLSKQSYVAEYR